MPMEVEHLESLDFLAAHPPFSALTHAQLERIVFSIQTRYARRGSDVLHVGVKNEHLFIVRSGAVELLEGGEKLSLQLSAGGCFAFPSLLRDGITRHGVKALEDSLLYTVPAAIFHALREECEPFRLYFSTAEADRLRAAIAAQADAETGVNEMKAVAAPLEKLRSKRRLVTAPMDIDVASAATLMKEEDVSTLLVMEDGALRGIVTDKDLRCRVLAHSKPYDTPIGEIMTRDPVTLEESKAGFEALLLMMREGFSHLPLTDASGRIVGLISARDLLKRMSHHALHLAQDVAKATSPQAVQSAVAPLQKSLISLVEADMTAHVIGQFVSSVGEAAHKRLAELGEAEFGRPPVPYALVVFGSLARQDQTGVSDQDNGFILDDSYDEATHGAYFRQLAAYISDGLDGAGYVYCSGGIMATNAAWRVPYNTWLATFNGWMNAPEPKAVMESSIFFDMRCVHGERQLVRDLRADVVNKAKEKGIFLAHMARDTLNSKPPLGFFRQFVLEPGNDPGKNRLDMKHRGAVPIVDIARLGALAHGVTAVNTRERFTALADMKAMNSEDVRDLLDALEFISMTRLRHQARQAANREKIDNFVKPDDLSRFERDHLKDAFVIVRRQQEAISNSYLGGVL